MWDRGPLLEVRGWLAHVRHLTSSPKSLRLKEQENYPWTTFYTSHIPDTNSPILSHESPCSRLCSLEEQYFKCGIFGGYDAAQRLASNSEAPVLAGWRLRVRVLGLIDFHYTFHQLVADIEREMTTFLCSECGKSFREDPTLSIHQSRTHDKTS